MFAMVAEKSELVVVSNRLPVVREGRGVWKTSPGGLVSALSPILKQRRSTWIGWPGTTGIRLKPFQQNSILNYPIPLSPREVDTFYEGFCNSTIWPLYHDAIRTPQYRREWWLPYVEVNRRFAEAAAEVVAPGGTVWIHDYHLQLVPKFLRELSSKKMKIGFFLHIPFPPQELFAQLPWRSQILRGLLAADVVGFQTQVGAQNFTQLAKRFTNAVGGKGGDLYIDKHRVHAGAYPVSIDIEAYETLAADPKVVIQAQELRSRLRTRKVILGVDRMDYTKGIDLRLRAFRELLKTKRIQPQDCVLVQLAVPSRERVAQYKELRSRVEHLVGEINGQFGELGRVPVHYLHRSLSPEELVALYLAADVMVVTPFRDGMNLVAKEYVATRLDNTGALVLSEFTGSARELRNALLVNPHDIDGVADTMYRALHMPKEEQNRRMRKLRRAVKKNDVFMWARQFLEALQ